MSRRRKDPLRPLTDEERTVLEQIARARSEPASHVARAKMLLAVAGGKTYQAAAEAAGRKSNDAVSQLVSRFNQEGLAALAPRHGGGPAVEYGPAEWERILAEARRAPDRERDGTATWTLSTLQRASASNWREVWMKTLEKSVSYSGKTRSRMPMMRRLQSPIC